MSSAFEALFLIVESFEQRHQEFSQLISDNKRILSDLKVASLIEMQFQGCKPLQDLRDFHIFINYRNESPLGAQSILSLYEIFTKFFSSMPDSVKPKVQPFISSAYVDGLCKELYNLENLADIFPCAEIYKKLRDFNTENHEIIDISTFKDSISLAVTFTSWSNIKEELDLNDLQEFENGFRILAYAAEIGLDVEDAAKNLAGYLLGDLAIKFNGLVQEGGEDVKNQMEKVKGVLFEVLKLKIEDPDFKSHTDLIMDVFSRCGIFIKEQFEVDSLNFNYLIEPLSGLIIQKILFGPVENQNYSLKVFLVKDNKNKYFALKIYSVTENNFGLDFLRKEVNILKDLSTYSNPDNCNLKFYGYCLNNSSYYFLTECYPQTLEDYLKINELDEEKIKNFGLKLCQFFVYLESIKCYHLDFRPQSIFVVNEKVLKVFNFYNYATGEHNIDSLIRTITDFTAPEIIEETNNIEKADNFSYGLTLLYMLLEKEERKLNIRENYKQFN